MKTPSEFDDIRPFDPDELPAVYERLLENKQFQAVVHFLYPKIPIEVVARKMRQCKTSMDFQLTFCYTFLRDLLKRMSKGCDMDISAIDNTRCYTFMSNHRDIVLDSALLDKLLIDAKFSTTCEIAIGDNLLSMPWVLDIVRVNKSFIVKRGLMARERLESSIKLSRYMHYAISEKHENLWIAQREGRAKDSDDRTQKAILKMLTLGGEGSVLEKLQQLHIVPLAISYEYDPCDYLKAAEFQAKRDNPEWKKGPMDDVISMRTGIIGLKGHIHYHAAPCIDDYLEGLKEENMPTGQLLETICAHIDREIHRNYRLYPTNYIALDELEGTARFTDHYTEEEKQKFDTYIKSRLAKIELPGKDEDFLRERMLTMYANPTRNYLKANG
ncbi:hypothetical protein [Prevotella dentasini]|uniref:hypothetical protein n=1 Tax=Prevotella dentasini TaxID=589537 RepID=UPI000468EE98|nr:hypothetical protein [Prevotella dentasini]